MLASTPEGEWIRCFHQSAGSDTRLVCFPHAGGSASYFFPLSGALSPTVETIALQYPGRQDRRLERCVESIAELADRIFDVLQGQVLQGRDDRPIAFFGHSMGSILAFEVAVRCRLAGAGAPVRLFASGYPAPSRLRGGSVHLRDEAGILAELREAGGTDPRWLEDRDLMASILPAVRSDYTAIETHRRSHAVLDCPITMLTGDEDPHTTPEEAAAWEEHTSREFELRVFHGGHFYLDEHGPEVIGTISETLQRAVR